MALVSGGLGWTSVLVLGSALVLSTCYVLSDLIALLWRQYFSPLQRLRGPPSPSFLFGNLREMYNQENTGLLYDWNATYGSTYAYKGFLGGSRLLTTDLTAITHILSRSDTYQKPDFVRESLTAMGAGNEGLLTTEGEAHRRQVSCLFPFAHSHLNCPAVAQDIGERRHSSLLPHSFSSKCLFIDSRCHSSTCQETALSV